MLYTSAAHTAHCLSGSSSVVPVKDEEQSVSPTANISIVMLGISSVVQNIALLHAKEPIQVFLIPLMLYGAKYLCRVRFACSCGLYYKN